MEISLAVIILTFNETQHIQRCIESIKNIAAEIFIVDSYSTDNTIELAQLLGAKTYQNKFINHANQLNWALDNCPIKSEWILRLDADETITSELADALRRTLPNTKPDISGFTINLRRYFMGKWLRYGSLYPIRMTRIWRKGLGHCENRWMDEHIIIDGKIAHINFDFSDHNLNTITWWTNKHNYYATKEAIEMLLSKKTKIGTKNISKNSKIKKFIKQNFYSKIPLGSRAFLYFSYRYFIRLGFLDGWEGLVFHVLQGFWYRFLVDVKIYELEQLMQQRQQTLEQVVLIEFGYDLGTQS